MTRDIWHNIAASNNAWSGGVTPAHLVAIATAKPLVRVFDLSDEALVGSTTGDYEIRADGAELWALLALQRIPEGDWHGESVLAQKPDGTVVLVAVALTTRERGFIQESLAKRYPGRVGTTLGGAG